MSLKGIFPIDKWDFESESIFADLPEADLEILLTHRSEQVYKKRENLYFVKVLTSGIFYIKNGKVKKYKVDRDGGTDYLCCRFR